MKVYLLTISLMIKQQQYMMVASSQMHTDYKI